MKQTKSCNNIPDMADICAIGGILRRAVKFRGMKYFDFLSMLFDFLDTKEIIYSCGIDVFFNVTN